LRLKDELEYSGLEDNFCYNRLKPSPKNKKTCDILVLYGFMKKRGDNYLLTKKSYSLRS